MAPTPGGFELHPFAYFNYVAAGIGISRNGHYSPVDNDSFKIRLSDRNCLFQLDGIVSTDIHHGRCRWHTRSNTETRFALLPQTLASLHRRALLILTLFTLMGVGQK